MAPWLPFRTSTPTTPFAWPSKEDWPCWAICPASRRCAISARCRSCAWRSAATRTRSCARWWSARGSTASRSPGLPCTTFSYASPVRRRSRRRSMRKILLMAKRDYVASVRTKSFIIGLVVAPLLFGGGGLGVAILAKRTDLRDKRIAVLDRTGLVTPHLLRAVAEKNSKEAYHKVTHAQTAALYVLETVAPSPGDPELQRRHPGETQRVAQPLAGRRDHAQVLGHQRQLASERPLGGGEGSASRSALPGAAGRVRRTLGAIGRAAGR